MPPVEAHPRPAAPEVRGPVPTPVGRSLLERKVVRYALVSVVAVAVSQATLAITFGALRWGAVAANVTATALATIPSYTLNRAWVWGRRGRSHLRTEVIPFWALAFVSLVASTAAAQAAEDAVEALAVPHVVATLLVMAATLAAFGTLWAIRFFILNRFLFAGDPGLHDAG